MASCYVVGWRPKSSPMPSSTTLVGTLASVLTISAFAPQVIRSWRTKSTRDLSYGTASLLVLQSAAWLGYGALIRDPAITITNGVTLTCTLLILAAKWRYG
jgi:MtN3 and saliva related transmembrane protein